MWINRTADEYRDVRFSHYPRRRWTFRTALFNWFVENIGTFAGAWIYPTQNHGCQIVAFAKMGSRFLLMLICFVLVTPFRAPAEEPPLDRRRAR